MNKRDLSDFMQNNIPRKQLSAAAEARFEAAYQMLGVQQEPKQKSFRRKRVWATAAACAVVVCGVSIAAPVFAEYLPAVGKYFQPSGDAYKNYNVQGKFAAGSNVSTYGVQAVTAETAVSENNGYKLSVESTFCDGAYVTFVWRMQVPEGDASRCEYLVFPDLTATVNGAEAKVIQPILYPEGNGEFLGTALIQLPKNMENGAMADINVTMPATSGKDKAQKDGRIDLNASFTLAFQATANTESDKAFDLDTVEDDGFKLLRVESTPMSTWITAELPDHSSDGEDPALYLEDGTELRFTLGTSIDAGYDPWSGKAQTAPLFFDGVPAGTEKVIFRFYVPSDGREAREKVYSEFTIDLNSGTAQPSKTYADDGALNLNSPFNYRYLDTGYLGENLKWSNDLAVDQMLYARGDTVNVGLQTHTAYREVKVELLNAEGTALGSAVSQYGTDYANDNWFWDETSPFWEMYSDSRGGSSAPYAYRIYIPLGNYLPAWHETLTVRVTDNATGEELLSQDLTFIERSF